MKGSGSKSGKEGSKYKVSRYPAGHSSTRRPLAACSAKRDASSRLQRTTRLKQFIRGKKGETCLLASSTSHLPGLEFASRRVNALALPLHHLALWAAAGEARRHLSADPAGGGWSRASGGQWGWVCVLCQSQPISNQCCG